MKKITKKKIIIISLAILFFSSILLLTFTKSAPLKNDVEVEQNSDLIYYLNVSYDGVDKTGIESNDTTIADIRSGYIYVEDELPEGLIFNGFVESPNSDGSIGAVARGDEDTCLGNVIDDSNGITTLNNYHGLHYDETNRKVTFQVKNLQAGCVLTVGIKTITPSLGSNSRLDFYNFATANEGEQTVNSNTVHVWMGEEKITQHKVTYKYSGTVPEGAPLVPEDTTYTEGTTVRVAGDVKVAGYKFSGWTSLNVTPTNGVFTMPSSDVEFIGSFTEEPKYNVTYELKEGSPVPDNYELPSMQSYYATQTVSVSVPKVGDIFNGYRFKGWTTSDVTVSTDNDFLMPEKNVTFIGEFEPVKYKVKYEFNNSVTFDNMNNYLPREQEYAPGDEVTLSSIDDSTISGYAFLGWYKESTFIMPNEDVTITGEWKVRSGTFSPTITKEIVNEKDNYKLGEVLTFNIKITNPHDYALKDVQIKEYSENAKFIEGTGYTIRAPHIAQITTLDAGATITLTAQYKVGKNDAGTMTAESSIIGALTDKPNYELDDSTDYKASVTFNVSELKKLKVCNTVNHTEEEFQYHITSSDTTYDAWFTVVGNKCKTLLLEEKEYQLTQINNQDYEIKSITGLMTSNGSNFTLDNTTNEILFNNEYKKRGFYHATGKVVNIVPKKNR